MQIQLNTDNHLVGSEGFATRLESELRSALDRYSDRVTRVEVHLADVNSGKAGSDDKHCRMEARVAGRQPMSVSHKAASVTLAIDGASDKLLRALDRIFGKREAERRSGARRPDDYAA